MNASQLSDNTHCNYTMNYIRITQYLARSTHRVRIYRYIMVLSLHYTLRGLLACACTSAVLDRSHLISTAPLESTLVPSRHFSHAVRLLIALLRAP